MRYDVTLKFKCESREFINRILDQIETDDALKLLTFELNQNQDYVPSAIRNIENKIETVVTEKKVERKAEKKPEPVVSSPAPVEEVEQLTPVVHLDEYEETEPEPLPASPVEKYKPRGNPQSIPKITIVSQSEVTESVSDLEPPKKRGPGRPPKSAATPAQAVTAESVTPPASQVSEVKRGPGRPPKVKSDIPPVFVANTSNREPMTEGHYQVGVAFGDQGEPHFTAQPVAKPQQPRAKPQPVYEEVIAEIEQFDESESTGIVYASEHERATKNKPMVPGATRVSPQSDVKVEYVSNFTGEKRLIGLKDLADAFLYVTEGFSKDAAVQRLKDFGAKTLSDLPVHFWSAYYQFGEDAKIHMDDSEKRLAEINRREAKSKSNSEIYRPNGHARYSNGRIPHQ